jgi:hypothetical protein
MSTAGQGDCPQEQLDQFDHGLIVSCVAGEINPEPGRADGVLANDTCLRPDKAGNSRHGRDPEGADRKRFLTRRARPEANAGSTRPQRRACARVDD